MKRKIVKVWIDNDAMYIPTNKGEIFNEWFADYPRLRSASLSQLADFEYDNIGICWKKLDEDLSYRGFFSKPMKRIKNSYFSYLCFFIVLLSSCAGTINTVKHTGTQVDYKKAVIISAENSQYIKFKPGIFIPTGTYIVLPDDAAKKHEVIGNTDEVIKLELEKYGIQAKIVKKGETVDEFDLLVEYYDTWRWDFKKILDKLEIVFISPNGEIIAKSTYNIYKNKELHNFPIPEKEVPKMIKELLNK